MMYNIAVIGCGYMGQSHLEDIYLRENVTIWGVCDADINKAKLVAERYNASHFYADYTQLTENPAVDIVIVATYPSSHLEILKSCIAHGKHVICEKPITANIEEGKEFVHLVKDNPQIKILIGHILRHNETYQLVADLIQKGVIGSPIILKMVQNHNTKGANKFKALIAETSPLIDCGVHYIDVMRWFTGSDIISASSIGARLDNDIPPNKYNYELITAQLADGSVGTYEVCWSSTIATDNTKEFIGPLGRIKIIYQKDRNTHKQNGNLIEIYHSEHNTVEQIDVSFDRKPTGEQLEHLIKMIEDDVPALPSIEDVFKSFEIVCKVDSMINKGVVQL